MEKRIFAVTIAKSAMILGRFYCGRCRFNGGRFYGLDFLITLSPAVAIRALLGVVESGADIRVRRRVNFTPRLAIFGIDAPASGACGALNLRCIRRVWHLRLLVNTC